MTKMKVYELAKELDIKSKDIISYLHDTGIEVKAAQSSLDEKAVEIVRKKFAVSGGNMAVLAAEALQEKKAEAVKEAKEKEAEAIKESEQRKEPQVKEEQEVKNEAVKATAENNANKEKKKKIIVVSNPHNSRASGGNNRQGANSNDRRQGGNNGNRAGYQTNSQGRPGQSRPGQNRQEKVENRPLIRPLTKPSQPQMPDEKLLNRNKPLKEERPNKEALNQNRDGQNRDNQNRMERNTERTNDRANRSERGDRPARTDRPFNGQNRQNQERTGRNEGRGENQGRTAYGNGQRNNQNSNRNANSGRPGGNNERPQRGDARPDNKFRKAAPGKAFMPETPIQEPEKHRDDEKRRQNQERDKRSKKDLIYEEDNSDKLKGKNKAGRFIKPEPKPVEKQEEQIKVIVLPETITIKELAEKMKMQPAAIIKKLFMEGKIVTLNQEISYEDAENIAIEFDIICEKEVKVDVIEELLKEDEENEEDMVPRPPVICVMGHVDHGKTSLLDAIRKTNVTDREAGGITQHIGAYTVSINGQKITFLDTPGHEAFTAMRMRGANSTDIAVLVVAADDGVMPQTVEAINHAKAAGIEIIVAVNKMDKPNANMERVKQELTEYELIAEDWGGSTVFVPVSAKNGDGIQQLLEMILLTAEVMELKANPNRRARGLVIEAELDKGRGPVATVLVQKGTLHVGDFVSAGASHGKVRAMIDDKGRRVKEAGPSTPVEILGLSDVPNAGEVLIAHENDKTAKSYAEAFIAQNKEKKLEETKGKMSLDDLFSQIKEGNLKELNLIVKADVQGSVEAVKQSLMKLSNEEVVVKCIHGGVGAINESDVMLASASNAIIIGFNVRPDATAKATAEREGVDVRLYKVIYQAIEDIEAAMKGMLDPVFEEKVIGHAEVRQIFRASAVGNIAGSYVLDGVFQRGCKVRITREGEQIYEGALASLKRFKDDVKEVKAGYECGLVFEGFDQMQELDIVEAYIMVEVPR